MTFKTWKQVPMFHPELNKQVLIPIQMVTIQHFRQVLLPGHHCDLIVAHLLVLAVFCLILRSMTCEISMAQLQLLHQL